MNFRWDCRADGCLAEGSFHSDVKAIEPKGGANGGLVSDWQLQFEFKKEPNTSSHRTHKTCSSLDPNSTSKGFSWPKFVKGIQE